MKSINRTHRLENVQNVAQGVGLIYAEAPGGMRKLRCPRCQQSLATASRTPDGNVVYCCPCGCRFQSTGM